MKVDKRSWKYIEFDKVGNFSSGYTPKSYEISENGAVTYFRVAEMNLPGTELAELLMAEYGWDIHRALDELSTTFAKLNDPERELCNQGAVYIFQFLKSEIETVKVA